MRYILTLNNVKRSDLDNVGFRAIDLALLREKRLNIPLTFVINNDAFEDFLNENGFKAKIEKVFQNKNPVDAYKEILELFSKAVMPPELEAELFEAYESLAIDPGATASTIVSEWDSPFVCIARSPSYLLSTENREGIIQNIRGKNNLLDALKLVWVSVYSPESVAYRKKTGITDSFGIGVLVQKMKKIEQSAVSYSFSDLDEKTILVKSFTGLQDYTSETEILGKDCHEVDADSLMITKADVNVQEYSIVRDPESFELKKHALGEPGSKQKLNDRQIYEAARITKRAKSFLGKALKLYLGIRNDYTHIFLVNRVVAGPKRIIGEKEEVKLTVDDEGRKYMEHEKEIIAGQEIADQEIVGPKIVDQEKAKEYVKEPVDMPKILSSEEAKKEIFDEAKDAEGAEADETYDFKEMDKELEQAEETEDERDEEAETEQAEQEEVEQEVEKEINLLEEVIKIKDVLERMEEHALNHNNPAYDIEAKRLKKMLERVREE